MPLETKAQNEKIHQPPPPTLIIPFKQRATEEELSYQWQPNNPSPRPLPISSTSKVNYSTPKS